MLRGLLDTLLRMACCALVSLIALGSWLSAAVATTNVQHSGERLFATVWAPSEGAGPEANAQSCAVCHSTPRIGGGGGPGTVVLISPETTDPTGGRLFRQFLIRPKRAVVRQPLPSRVFRRGPPSLLGLGLLEGADVRSIVVHADPEDRDGDGVSGRMAAGGGRVGCKARFATLDSAVAAAFVNELGLTNAMFGEHGTRETEVGDAELRALTEFVRTLAPPSRPRGDSEGRAEFTAFGCAACHVPQLRGVSDRHGTLVEAFTDLLLHDMGPELADLPEGDAAAGEFRTPPLWGLGSMGGPYLHNGSATTLDAAIRAHGGEGGSARHRYEQASTRRRAALLRFLGSL